MPFKPFRKTHNYFVSDAGYVFKIENGKEVKCQAVYGSNTKQVVVKIDGKVYPLLNIMIEHFLDNN